MRTNEFISVKFEDVGINIKAVIKIMNEPIFVFNCHTKYEDSAEEQVAEVFKEVLTPLLKIACEKSGCQVHTLSEYEGEEYDEY